MRAFGYCCGNLIEMKLHGSGVAEGSTEDGAGAMFGTYRRPNRSGRLAALIMGGFRDSSPSWPSDIGLCGGPDFFVT